MVTNGDPSDKTALSGNAHHRRGDLFRPTCPTRQLLDRLGGKWTSMLVKVLGDAAGEVRFAELQRRCPGISRKMLAQTLRELEADGLVTRRVEPTVPPAVHYALTPLGQTLIAPLDALRDWAETHMPAISDRRRLLAPER